MNLNSILFKKLKEVIQEKEKFSWEGDVEFTYQPMKNVKKGWLEKELVPNGQSRTVTLPVTVEIYHVNPFIDCAWHENFRVQDGHIKIIFGIQWNFKKEFREPISWLLDPKKTVEAAVKIPSLLEKIPVRMISRLEYANLCGHDCGDDATWIPID